MLSTLILAGFLFHRHHAKPTPAPAPPLTFQAKMQDATTDYAKTVIDRVAQISKDHPELEPMSKPVLEDLENLYDDTDRDKYLKDLDKTQDDLEKMSGKAWALDHYITT